MSWNIGVIQNIIYWEHNHFSLKISGKIPNFFPGQFIKLGLEVEGELIHRPYSIVSAPNAPELEVYITCLQGGSLSPRLRQLKAGDTIWISEQSYGHFGLGSVRPCERLWFFAAGSGIAPFLSMLRAEIPQNQAETMILVHSIKTRKDCVYQALLEKLKQLYCNRFYFTNTLTQESQPNTLQGRIADIIGSGALLNQLGFESPKVENTQAMICGRPEMVQSVQTALLEYWGLKRHSRFNPGEVHVERY